MDIDNAAAAGIIVKNGQWIKDSANSLLKSQYASAASAATNEKEQAEYAKIAEQKQFAFVQEGSSVALQEQEAQVSPFEKIIEEGMSAPVSGGSGGTVTNPDGSTYHSKVPPQLWGTELPEYAKEPNPVADGVQQMLQTLVPQWVNDVVAGSTAEIAELVKGEVTKEIQSMLGGVAS